MGLMQRSKGKGGEREVAGIIRDLTGWDVRRRVRQHDGDSDLTGVDGWCVEVKRHKTATRGQIALWWLQTTEQAARQRPGGENGATGLKKALLPVLIYRKDRDEWRAVWPLLLDSPPSTWLYSLTAESTIDGWVAIARELEAGRMIDGKLAGL